MRRGEERRGEERRGQEGLVLVKSAWELRELGAILASLLGARTLLGAPGLTTRSKKLLRAKGIATRSKKLLGAPGIATRSKDATRGSWPYYYGISQFSRKANTTTKLLGVAGWICFCQSHGSILSPVAECQMPEKHVKFEYNIADYKILQVLSEVVNGTW